MSHIQGFELTATSKQQMSAKVLTLDEMDYFLILHLPDLGLEYKVYDIEAIDNSDTITEEKRVPIFMWKQLNRNTLRINSAVLKRTSGYHEYKVHIVNTITDTTKDVYFSYILQLDNKNRDYIYMTNARKAGKSNEN